MGKSSLKIATMQIIAIPLLTTRNNLQTERWVQMCQCVHYAHNDSSNAVCQSHRRLWRRPK